MITKNGKQWDVDAIKKLLQRNDKAVTRALVVLYQCQTADEQIDHDAKSTNGIGFNKIDSEILSSFAEQIMAGRTLSIKQMDVARKRVLKYSKQLLNMVDKNS